MRARQGLILDSSAIGVIFKTHAEKEGQFRLLKIQVSAEGKILLEDESESLLPKFFHPFSQTSLKRKIDFLELDLSAEIHYLHAAKLLRLSILIATFFSIIFVFTFIFLKERQRREVQDQLYNISLSVAHDIRSPVQTIKMALVEGDNKLATQQLLALEKIANELLKANRHLKIKPQKQERLFDLVSLIKNLEDELRTKYPKTNFSIQCQPSSNPLYALGDYFQVERILKNISQNSVQACSNNNAQVDFNLYKNKARFILRVSDNGPGFTENYLSHAFQTGFSEKNSGNGVGLSSAKKYLESINGQIEITNSKDNPGAVVELQFLPAFETSRLSSVAFLDDEMENTKIWELAAKKKGVRIHTFHDAFEMLENTKFLPKETFFFIDWHRKDNCKNEQLIAALKNYGFKKIYASSALPLEALYELPLPAIGKQPPFL